MSKQFKAMVVAETAVNTYQRTIQTRSTDDLPAGDLLIRVHYSSLNYKDGLSASGNKGVTPPSSKRIVIEPSGTSPCRPPQSHSIISGE